MEPLSRPERARAFPLSSPGALTILGVGFLVAWSAAFVQHELATDGLVDRQNNAVGRDFLAFFAAGRLVARGEGRLIFDGARQQKEQATILAPQVQEGFVYYVNPPFVAAAYAPLSQLPYRISFYIHVVLMLGCLLLGMRVLRPHLPRLHAYWPATLLLVASSFPMLHTVLGGQNCALSFFLLASVYAAIQARRPVTAGAGLGLQLFKPQLALPFALVLALAGQWAAIAGVAGIAALEYLMGALVSGWPWPLSMARALTDYYRPLERVANGPKHIALLEVVDYSLVQPLASAGHRGLAGAARLAGYAGVLGLVGWAIALFRRSSLRAPSLAPAFALLLSLTLLVSPHTQHYEAALLVLSVLLLLDEERRMERQLSLRHRLMLLATYAVFPLLTILEVSRPLRLQPMVLLPVWVLLWARRALAMASGDGS